MTQCRRISLLLGMDSDARAQTASVYLPLFVPVETNGPVLLRNLVDSDHEFITLYPTASIVGVAGYAYGLRRSTSSSSSTVTTARALLRRVVLWPCKVAEQQRRRVQL